MRRSGRTALTLAVCAGVALAASAAGAAAQQVTPRVPAGVKLAILPVQDVAPAPSGAWPGGASSRADALDRINAELDFALASAEGVAGWPGPRELTRMVERNPMIDAHPHRLAVGRIDQVEPGEGRLRATLHRQLRRLSALADVRIVAIPLRLAWRVPGGDGEGGGEAAGAEGAGGSATGPGRPVLELALVDTRAARVLWRGEVAGPEAPPGEPGALATLAADLVALLSP